MSSDVFAVNIIAEVDGRSWADTAGLLATPLRLPATLARVDISWRGRGGKTTGAKD